MFIMGNCFSASASALVQDDKQIELMIDDNIVHN